MGDFVIDGQSGLLARDDTGLAAALARLVRDRPLLQRLAENNRSTDPVQVWPHVAALAEAEDRRAGAG